MTFEGRSRPHESHRFLGRLGRSVMKVIWPTQRLLWTREGIIYIGIWVILLSLGLSQQLNLILLVAGLAAGPVAASFFASSSMLNRLKVTRRMPSYTFSGDPLQIDYTLDNERRWSAALALFVEDEMFPVEKTGSAASLPTIRVFFAGVPSRSRERVRWQGVSPHRGRYKFRHLEMITRAPFGLLERRVSIDVEHDELIVYPMVGQLSRRWQVVQKQATETRRGQRHDRSSQQQEYHGLRDYRAGDSPRWIHWRTSARLGQLMVKEFEQQNDQDLAILVDPWLPRTKATPEQRETLEQVVRFAATVSLEICRHQGRRLLLGWTGAAPGLRQGPASVKLLHELLEQLAVLRGSSEGTLSSLLDLLPPTTLRESILVVVSTRPINLIEEAERSPRLSDGASRGWLGRVVLMDASKGDLNDLVQFATATSKDLTSRETASAERQATTLAVRDTRRGLLGQDELDPLVDPMSRELRKSPPAGKSDSPRVN